MWMLNKKKSKIEEEEEAKKILALRSNVCVELSISSTDSNLKSLRSTKCLFQNWILNVYYAFFQLKKWQKYFESIKEKSTNKHN